MTRIEKLQNQIGNLESQVLEINKERHEIERERVARLNEYFSGYFSNDIDKDIVVEVNNGGVCFKMPDEDTGYLKEVFNIYLKEDYSFEENKPKYEDVYLNYYTTHADNDFEFKRLENLGRVAVIMRNLKDQILNSINNIGKIYDNKISEGKYYQRAQELEKQIKGINSEIKSIQKEENKNKLFNEGLTFVSGMYIRLKGNFEPRIGYLRLTNVSKSGKKATAEYSYFNDKIYIEEGVNVERIVSQLISAS